MIKKILCFFKKELMLTAALLAAVISLFITPPGKETLSGIDWRTLGTLFMMLCVLEGFKRENVLGPVARFGSGLKRMTSLTLFLVFGVFFTSMFVTNDVSLIIFVPLTISIFRGARREKYILPVITLENIAAIRGSMLTPFGSPQNLFLYGQIDVSVWRFSLHMLPLSALSAVLLVGFIFFLYRKNTKEEIGGGTDRNEDAQRGNRTKKISYIILFAVVVGVIVTRTQYWYFVLAAVVAATAVIDWRVLIKVDYVLLLTFLCFFVFSSSITSNAAISSALGGVVAGKEYWWSIGLSQLISNVPSTIVLYPFSKNFAGLIYGADSAGLVSLIGSLASVINYRIYVREYPGQGWKFIKTFTLISLAFFALVVVPGYLLSAWSFV
ncbi:MAG: citrate transporter [Clostridia bacterium]|nr:citrate transporter [Clostridia bacterium]